MKSSKTSFRNIVSQMRFDASFHLSEGLLVRNIISSSPYPILKISDYSDRIFYGNRDKRIYVKNKERGIPFLSSSDILLADLNNIKYVSSKYTKNIEVGRLEYGWTLITRSGTVGKTTWCTELHSGKISSEHVIRVVPNNLMKPGCLYAYLSSKYGYSLLTQGMFGAVIQSIEPSYISSLPIPAFPIEFQTEVDDLIHQYSFLRENAQRNLDTALALFESEIGIPSATLGFSTETVSSMDISDIFTRFDAQYQIGTKQLNRTKENTVSNKIGDCASQILIGNRGKRNYVESNGIPFLSSSEMMLANPLRYFKQISKKTPNVDNLIVHEGDILISRSGTVGNTVIIGKILDGIAISEHAIKLRINSSIIPPEYVFAYLRTKQGSDALKIVPYGSVIITLGEEFLANIDLPIIAHDKMERIVDLIKKYVLNFDESIIKENMAIELVEQEIEKWNN